MPVENLKNCVELLEIAEWIVPTAEIVFTISYKPACSIVSKWQIID